jgi:hypothetical protein
MANYTVFDEGKVISGSAKKVLERIRAQIGKENKEIAKLNVEQYATALIEDAPYFLPDDLLESLKKQEFDSNYDRALTYLGQMPTSGIRIMTVEPVKQ